MKLDLSGKAEYKRTVHKSDPNKIKKNENCVKVKWNKWLCNTGNGKHKICDVKKEKCKPMDRK